MKQDTNKKNTGAEDKPTSRLSIPSVECCPSKVVLPIPRISLSAAPESTLGRVFRRFKDSFPAAASKLPRGLSRLLICLAEINSTSLGTEVPEACGRN